MTKFRLILFFSLTWYYIFGQSGISVTPPRTYFTLGAGESDIKTISVTNVSASARLDLSVSFNDWKYDDNGNNVVSNANTLATSSADWLQVSKQTFSLDPGESYDLQLRMSVPSTLNAEPVHTAMMYITQTNPSDGVNDRGASIKIAVRTGVKIYQRLPSARSANIEFLDYKRESNKLLMKLENTGNIWAEGTITTDLLNTATGKKIKAADIIFYTMPGDRRNLQLELPADLEKGNYVATSIVDYESSGAVKIAELEFGYD